MQSFLILISQIIQIYVWILILTVVFSWLIAFNVINTRNRFVYTVVDVLNRLTEPLLRPIRRVLPDMGGIDVSPILLLLLLYFIRNLLWEVFGSVQ